MHDVGVTHSTPDGAGNRVKVGHYVTTEYDILHIFLKDQTLALHRTDALGKRMRLLPNCIYSSFEGSIVTVGVRLMIHFTDGFTLC